MYNRVCVCVSVCVFEKFIAHLLGPNRACVATPTTVFQLYVRDDKEILKSQIKAVGSKNTAADLW